MAVPVQITLIVCITLVALTYISGRKKDNDKE